MLDVVEREADLLLAAPRLLVALVVATPQRAAPEVLEGVADQPLGGFRNEAAPDCSRSLTGRLMGQGLSHRPHETHFEVSALTCSCGARTAAPSFSPMTMNGAIQQMQWHIARRPRNRLGMKNSAR